MASGGAKDRVTKTSSNPSQAEDREWSVLLIGMMGTGKSSLGNTILGRNTFDSRYGMSRKTQETKADSGMVLERRLKVIDTADFFNMPKPTEGLTHAGQVASWKEITSNSPDVIVFLIRCDDYETHGWDNFYQDTVREWNDEELFKRRLMVAFTFQDEDEGIEREFQTRNTLIKVLADAKNRYVFVNNKEKDERKKNTQLTNIYRVIDGVIRENEVALVLVGKTGQGKSSLGNLLTRTPGMFETRAGVEPVTRTTRGCWAALNHTKFKVIDMPDLSTLDEGQELQELKRWKEMTQGIDVIMVLVFRCDVRMTSDELAVYRDVKRLWGDRDYKVMVVFTFGDRLDYSLEEQLQKCQALKEVMEDAENVHVLVNSSGLQTEDGKKASALKVLSLIDRVRGMATKRTA